MTLERLHDEGFNRQHDADERQRIGQEQRDIEKLEGAADLEADAVRAAEQLDDKHDLPDKRKARARRRGDIGRKLRHHDMSDAGLPGHGEDRRHFLQPRIERTGALADRRHRIGQFVERDGEYSGNLRQPEPDIGKHDDDECWQVQQNDEPGIAETVERRAAPHQDAEDRAEHHRQCEGNGDARQCRRHIEIECVRMRLAADDGEHRKRRGQEAAVGDHRGRLPERDEN